MDVKKMAMTVTMTMGILSFICLILFYLALTDIWHGLGRPDFWNGQGESHVEWRLLGYAYWPMFFFHVIFIVTSACILISNSQKKQEPPAEEKE